jgi:hypothetical protein
MSAQSLLNTPDVTFVENIVTPTIQTNTINSSNTLSLNSAQAIDLNSVDPIVLTSPNVSVSNLLITPTIETDAINSNNQIVLSSNTAEIGISLFQQATQLEALTNQFNIVAPQVLEIIAGNFINLQSPANISLGGVTATAPDVALSTNNTQIATTASVLSLLGTYIQFGTLLWNPQLSEILIAFQTPYASNPVVVFSAQNSQYSSNLFQLYDLTPNNFTLQQTGGTLQSINVYWIAIGVNPIIP